MLYVRAPIPRPIAIHSIACSLTAQRSRAIEHNFLNMGMAADQLQ